MKALLILPFLLVFTSCGKKEDTNPQAGPPPAFPVQVTTPQMQEIQLTRTYTGRFVPVERVNLRARVSGIIQDIHYTEGQPVKKGDPLISIDPALFDAELAAAQAMLAQADAAVTLAQQNATRAEELIQRRGISKEDYDSRQARLRQTEADHQLAEAQLKRAELNRSYADISAPISGIIGRQEITIGNYIGGGSPAAPVLTTIIPHSPIYCEFEIDERQVLEYTRLYFDGKANGRNGEPVEVEIAVSDSDTFSIKGSLIFSDNTLDTSTASLQMRAIVKNTDQFLTPGLFARVRIPVSTQGQKMVVPETSLGFDQTRRYIWVVTPQNTTERRYLEVGELVGDKRIVIGGLEQHERIAISGIQLLRANFPVQPIEN